MSGETPAPSDRSRRVAWTVLGSLGVALLAWLIVDRYGPGRMLVHLFTPRYRPPLAEAQPKTKARGRDHTGAPWRVTLRKIAAGFDQITDLQFPPGRSDIAIVLQKEGTAQWLAPQTAEHGALFRVAVSRGSEEGLLGLAFHPRFEHNGVFYLDYVRAEGTRHLTRIAQWRLSAPGDPRHATAREERVLLEVEQPFQNHNAGQLAFGPDGYLYVGLGDGGLRDDPFDHGQDPRSLLGKMLRLDVDRAAPGQPYAVPADNPFLADRRFRPEIFALGLRNPWRYSFDPRGRLIVADVGQDAWEEISIVGAGDNLGWDRKEGLACTDSGKPCARAGMVDPIHVYGRDAGASITGGYVYTGERVPQLRGYYVFADFVRGRVFALLLPDDRATRVQASLIGQWPMLPVTFGRDADGELYVGDFGSGAIFAFDVAAGSR